jgi:hypothetical protein
LISSSLSLSLKGFILVPSTPSRIAAAILVTESLFFEMSWILFFSANLVLPWPSSPWQLLHLAV